MAPATPADMLSLQGTWNFSQEDVESGIVQALFEIESTPALSPHYSPDGETWVQAR